MPRQRENLITHEIQNGRTARKPHENVKNFQTFPVAFVTVWFSFGLKYVKSQAAFQNFETPLVICPIYDTMEISDLQNQQKNGKNF